MPTSLASPIVQLDHVSKRLPSGGRILTILDDITLGIERSESIAIIGPSGSGKSTLLAIMAGLDTPSEGKIFLHGKPIHDMSEDQLALLRRNQVGFVFQSFHLLANQTAFENVLLPLEISGRSGARERASQLIHEVGLADRAHHYPVQLSGGEQQRIALARAFAIRPTILFADEPTGNLDSSTGSHVLDLLETLRNTEGTTLVMVTHDRAVAKLADRTVELVDGRLVDPESG